MFLLPDQTISVAMDPKTGTAIITNIHVIRIDEVL